MRRLNSRPVDVKLCSCPQCGKLRMTRPLDHVVSQEKKKYKAYSGEEIELFFDVCDYCLRRNYHQYFEPQKSDIKKILKSLHEQTELDPDQSLEDFV